MFNVKRNPNENEWQYLWRLGQAKDSGLLDIEWSGIADLMNQEFGDPDKPYSEAAYRKPYQMAKRFFESGVFNDLDEDSYIRELDEQKRELIKEQTKMRDERNELNRVIREEARKESYKDQVLRAIAEYQPAPLEYNNSQNLIKNVNTDNDLIIPVTDIHAGIEIDNYFNEFNENILKLRLNKYLDKIMDIKVRHGSENVYVILSELVSGIIHNELRIESNQNLIEQFLMVINFIAEFLEQLSYAFNEVHVYVCPGNHSRVMPKKEDSLKGENFDHLALPFLEAKMQNFDNMYFHYNKEEESVAIFSVRGKNIMAAHGDKDSPDSVVQKFTMMFGIKPDIVYLGHRHTNAMSTVYNTKVVQSGCISGVDNYCLDRRLNGYPEQTVSVVTNDGLECLYDIELNEY